MRKALALLLALPLTGAGAQTTTVAITEWTVPWEKTRPRDPYVDQSGKVWFVGQSGNYIAHLDPKSGEFKRFEIEEGTHPHNLIVGADGGIWYTGNRNGRVGRLDPATGKAKIFMMPNGTPRDPHTLIMDKSGNIWFTAQQGNHVGHIVAKTGEVHVMPSLTENSRPYGIVLDASSRPWFTLFNSNKVASIDPASMKITEYELPDAKSRARRIEIDRQGTIWYGDYMRGKLIRFNPQTKAAKEFDLPAGAGSLPYALALDGQGRVWIAETGVQPNRLVGFDPKAEKFFSITPVAQSGAGTIRHMVYHAGTNSLWFGTDANTIGRASLTQR
jgi:virginiamycin B lyase